jgi:hypothetical protein
MPTSVELTTVFPEAFSWDQMKHKGKFALYLTKRHAMKTYWGVEVQIHALLDSALDEGKWSASSQIKYQIARRAKQ